MRFNGPLFWFLAGLLCAALAAVLRSLALRRGLVMGAWTWLLSAVWYLLFCTTFYAFGTLVGENEPEAGFRFLLIGSFLSLVVGVGLWRRLTRQPSRPAGPPAEQH
jgi:hypothetical protein